MKPVLDETGRLIPPRGLPAVHAELRRGGGFCRCVYAGQSPLSENQRREDVKSHHYIISFDPRDGPDNGLTVDRAQALGGNNSVKSIFPATRPLSAPTRTGITTAATFMCISS